MNQIDLGDMLINLQNTYCKPGAVLDITAIRTQLQSHFDVTAIIDWCRFIEQKKRAIGDLLHFRIRDLCNPLPFPRTDNVTEGDIANIRVGTRVLAFENCETVITKVLQKGKTGVFIVDITLPDGRVVPKILKIERSGGNQIQEEAKLHLKVKNSLYYFQTLIAEIQGLKYPAVLMDYMGKELKPAQKTQEIYLKAKKEFEKLHKNGFIHGDVKEANMVYDPITDEVHLIDFGGAIDTSLKPLNDYGTHTTIYVAPYLHEQKLVPANVRLFPTRMMDDYISLIYTFLPGSKLPWDNWNRHLSDVDRKFLRKYRNREQASFDDFVPSNVYEYVYKILLDPKSEFNQNFIYSYNHTGETDLGRYLQILGTDINKYLDLIKKGYNIDFQYFKNEILFIFKTWGLKYLIDNGQIPQWLVDEMTAIAPEEFSPYMAIHRNRINRSLEDLDLAKLIRKCYKQMIRVYPEHLDPKWII